MHKVTIVVITSLTLLAGGVWGAGFEIPEMGARAHGVAMAFTSIADDPSAAWFNPAGLGFLDGTQATVGFTTIMIGETEFSGRNAGSVAIEVDETAHDELFNISHLYLVSDLGQEKIRVGLSVNSPFGLEKSWPNGSTFASDIVEIGLAPVFINPSVAYRVMSCMSVAAGFTVVKSGVALAKAPYNYSIDTDGDFDFTDGDRMFNLELEGTGTGTGFNVGLLGRFMEEKLSLGVLYRSEIDIEYEGDVSIGDISPGYVPVDMDGDGIPETPVPVSQALFGITDRNTTDTGKTNLAFPGQLRFGVSYRVIEPLLLTADLHMTMWSSYKELALDFETYDSIDKVQEKNWEDSNAFRFGALYRVCPRLEAAVGFVTDESPIPDATLGPELPDSDRTGLTLGLNIVTGGHTGITIGFMHLMPKDRDVDNLVLPSPETSGIAALQSGTYKNSATLFSVSLNHAF